MHEIRNREGENIREDALIKLGGEPVYESDVNIVPAWEISQGKSIIVGIIDTGIDITHEDLLNNIYVNKVEVPGNGIDDDQNSYIDDVGGWNFGDDSGNVFDFDNPDEEIHGTHIAGIIAAEKDNGKGITGIAPDVKILPLKVFKNGIAYTSNIIEAIEYAEKMGVKVINCSWGTTVYNQALEEAIQESGMLFVCAAGNSGTDNDQVPIYPASFELDNIISVASIDINGQLSAFSNYGKSTVDIAAPGEEILSTVPVNLYKRMSDTSAAAGFVTGQAALIMASDAELNNISVKKRILSCGDRLSSLTEKIYSESKMNCGNAIRNIVNNKVINVGIPAFVIPVDQNQCSKLFKDYSLLSIPDEMGTIIDVSSGDYYNLVLSENGTVWAWGSNYYGQLGDGHLLYVTTPIVSIRNGDHTASNNYLINCEADKIYTVIFTTDNININECVFTVEYNFNDLEVIDLCGITYEKENTTGIIGETNISIIQLEPGVIKFSVDKTIPSDKSWSGIVNSIKFRCIKASDTTTITCGIQ